MEANDKKLLLMLNYLEYKKEPSRLAENIEKIFSKDVESFSKDRVITGIVDIVSESPECGKDIFFREGYEEHDQHVLKCKKCGEYFEHLGIHPDDIVKYMRAL